MAFINSWVFINLGNSFLGWWKDVSRRTLKCRGEFYIISDSISQSAANHGRYSISQGNRANINLFHSKLFASYRCIENLQRSVKLHQKVKVNFVAVALLKTSHTPSSICVHACKNVKTNIKNEKQRKRISCHVPLRKKPFSWDLTQMQVSSIKFIISSHSFLLQFFTRAFFQS